MTDALKRRARDRQTADLTDQQQADIVERILAGTDHEYKTPETCSHGGSANVRLHCPVCDGGLSVCRVCGLSEGSLTTECPKEWVSIWVEKDVYQGKVDYRNGQWVRQPSPNSPAAYR